jgi:hypothetical protein
VATIIDRQRRLGPKNVWRPATETAKSGEIIAVEQRTGPEQIMACEQPRSCRATHVPREVHYPIYSRGYSMPW